MATQGRIYQRSCAPENVEATESRGDRDTAMMHFPEPHLDYVRPYLHPFLPVFFRPTDRPSGVGAR
jgi:hypothetical protein